MGDLGIDLKSNSMSSAATFGLIFMMFLSGKSTIIICSGAFFVLAVMFFRFYMTKVRTKTSDNENIVFNSIMSILVLLMLIIQIFAR